MIKISTLICCWTISTDSFSAVGIHIWLISKTVCCVDVDVNGMWLKVSVTQRDWYVYVLRFARWPNWVCTYLGLRETNWNYVTSPDMAPSWTGEDGGNRFREATWSVFWVPRHCHVPTVFVQSLALMDLPVSYRWSCCSCYAAVWSVAPRLQNWTEKDARRKWPIQTYQSYLPLNKLSIACENDFCSQMLQITYFVCYFFVAKTISRHIFYSDCFINTTDEVKFTKRHFRTCVGNCFILLRVSFILSNNNKYM